MSKLEDLAKTVINGEPEPYVPRYRTERSARSNGALTFTNFKVQYHLNVQKNELEELPDKLDIQAQIDSARTSCLDYILNSFLEGDPNLMPVVDQTASMRDDLDFLAEALETAEQYRDKYHLPDEMPAEQVFDFVSKQAQILTERMARQNSSQKGGLQNESEKNIKESVEEKLQTNGKTGSQKELA